MFGHGVVSRWLQNDEEQSAMSSPARALLSGLAAVLFVLAQTNVMAQEAPRLLSTHNKWTAWSMTEGGALSCYISSVPDRSEPAGVNRSPISFIVIHRKSANTRNEVQSMMGYPLNSSDPKASATIDGKTYPMVAEGEGTWLASTADEAAFVEGMKKGTQLMVRGTSQRGTNTVDTYSLSGVTAAMAAIDGACP
jgi:hypothetical protein